LYVSPADERRPRWRARRRRDAILNDIAALAGHYGETIRPVVCAYMAADDAIVSAPRRTGSDFIVMGVTRRVGEPLFFGNTAASVFKRASTSILLLST
jgi:nucleotide-binding universal stress UspA family protein